MAKATSKNAKVKDAKAAAESKNWTKVIRVVRVLNPALILLKSKLCTKKK